MPNVGPMELIIVLAIALIVLGPKKLPEVGKSLGKGLREFKEAMSGDSDDDREERPALPTEYAHEERPAPKSESAPEERPALKPE
jgi:sec-independent protein translocase protein TatA